MYFSLVFGSLATLSWLMLNGVDMEGAVLSTMLVSPRRYSEVARWTSVCMYRELKSRPPDYEVEALLHELPRRGLLIREYKCEISWLCSIFLALMSLFLARQPPVGQGLLIHEVSRSHITTHSVGLLLTSDQLVAETSTWQHTTLTIDRHSSPRWDSNPQSQQRSGRRPTP